MTDQEILELLKDPAIYEWQLRRKRNLNPLTAFGLVAMAALGPAAGLFVLWALESLHPMLALVCAALGLTVAATISGSLLWAKRALRKRLGENADAVVRATGSIGVIAHLIVLVSLGYILTSPISPLHGGFRGPTLDRVQWLLLVVDNFLKAVLLDTLEVFELHFSSIAPETWFARTAMWVFNLALSAVLVESIVVAWRLHRRASESFYSTGADLVGELFAQTPLVVMMEAEIARTGMVSRIEDPRPMRARDFIRRARRLERQNNRPEERST